MTGHRFDQRVVPTTAKSPFKGRRLYAILQSLTDIDLDEIKYYYFTTGRVDGVEAIISRTGYTGEDGFEVYAAAEFAEQLWNKFLETGKW